MDSQWNDGPNDGPTKSPKFLIILTLVTLTVAAGTGFLGYVFGRSYGALPPPSAAAAPVACIPADANTAEAMAKRNIVWRVWNGDGESLTESP